MFAATPEPTSHAGAPQAMTGPGAKVKKKKSRSPEVTLPPLCSEPSFHSTARTLFSVRTLELPPFVDQVETGGPRETEGSRLVASALWTNVPVIAPDELKAQRCPEKDGSNKVTAVKEKKTRIVKNEKVNKAPLTGTEVVHILTQRRQGEPAFYYLKEVDGDSYRPYDLTVVPPSEAGSEHYIFSPENVLHVTQKGFGGLISLAEWNRESELWKALQRILFFRDFRLHKAFTWWKRNGRKIIFQRKCKVLQDMLLVAVPQFRNALFQFTRVIEEVRGTQLLPRGRRSKTYTLLDFKDELVTMNQERLHILEKLSQSRTVILNTVKEDSHKSHQELQLHMEYAEKPNQGHESIHLHLAHQRELKRELICSENIQQKLGNFAALVNQMTLQSLVTVVQQDVVCFLDNVVKKNCEQCCLFTTELCFTQSDSQLMVDPPVRLFQEAVSEALLTSGDSIIQMCESCGFLPETTSGVFTCDVAQDSTSDSTCYKHPTLTENNNYEGIAGHKQFCCWKSLRNKSACGPVLHRQTLLRVHSNRLHGCYYPLPKEQLEWQIVTHDVTKRVEKELTKIMQETEEEIRRLCESRSWLLDVQLFISQWSSVSLESIKGQSAVSYEEIIKKVRHWTQKLHTVPSSVSTSNQLFLIQCTRVKKSLGHRLALVEEEVLEQLIHEIKLRSESVISDLEGAAAELKTEPRDLHDLSRYAVRVRESVKLSDEVQNSLEYIHSLQDTVRSNYRKMNEQEVTLEEKMLATLALFIPLLKQAESIVHHRLPSVANAVDTMFSFLTCDLENVVSKATSGPFLDPTQNATEMISELNHMCLHVQSLFAKLEQLSRDIHNLHEHPKDLTILTAHVQKVEARKQLWELIAVYTAWLEEWKQLDINEVVMSQAQENIAKWTEKVLSLTSIIPTHDALLQKTLGLLESLSHQVEVMAKFQSPTLKHRHWRAILEAIGLHYDSQKTVTVADVMMSQHAEVDQKLISKICRDALVECDMEQTFQKLQQGWEARVVQLDTFTLPTWKLHEPQHGLMKATEDTASQHSSTLTVFGLEVHFAEVESDLMALSTMLKSPHTFDFRPQVEDLMQSLEELGKVLCLFERYQQIWAFLTKMFHETQLHRADLLEQFQPADATYKEMMLSISSDPHVLNLVKKTNDSFQGNSLYQIIIEGLSTMEAICNQMVDLMEILCEQCPRLWFLSDRELIQLLSFSPTPLTLQSFVRKCFKGIRWLQMDYKPTSDAQSCGSSPCQSHHQMIVLGFFGSLHEHVTFPIPLEPDSNALVWLCDFERSVKLTMEQLMKQCAIVRNQLGPASQDLACYKDTGDVLERRKISLPVLGLMSEYPLQCLLVAEEAVWCQAVQQAFRESSPATLTSIKEYYSAKLENLSRAVRDGVSGTLLSKYTMTCLHALVQRTMKHARLVSRLMEVQCVLESSFEWLSLMKYHINSEDRSLNEPACYVDVFGRCLRYDYEYFGPDDWAMAHTPSTDRALLGILLALSSYRCGFVSGLCTSGKKTTVVQLGKALGRQVVTMQCLPNTRPGVVRRMLLGALQTGAWLVLDSVDLLQQEVLSLLGQHVADIYQSFSEFTRVNKDRTADGVTGCKVDPGCHMTLAGKRVCASLSYGCILISSKGRKAELPEGLRSATRPVALTGPDYRVIAEVMLTSIGFSEATSLSQRLVALFSLANDSLCLPEFISNNQSCYLVFLRKIISTSEIHLRQSARQREWSHKAEQTPFQDAAAREKQTSRSHLSIIQALMEETSIVKAILSVFLPVLFEDKKASQFYILFKDTFPVACQFPLFQHHLEDEEKKQINDAVIEELRRKCFHRDADLISSAVSLYQALKFSQAVILIGPSGSGKTTCYHTLAGALNHLSDTAFKSNNSINTVVLFPNAMSHEELFGFYHEPRGWQDGAVAKLLRDSVRHEALICDDEKKSDMRPVTTWLVMDGNPVGQPGWLDPLTTMCSPEEPFLGLSSGETLPCRSDLKLLMEVTDIRDASPSAVTRCSLVYLTGTDLWKAVWKSQMDALRVEHKLDQATLRMWNRLAEDLFSSTLSLVGQNALTSAIHNKGESLRVSYGMQEILSFFQILRALLQHFEKDVEKATAVSQRDKKDVPQHRTRPAGTDIDLLLRSLFLVAYIWGFGGSLHPRHRPQFDSLARRVLFSCRYNIVVPDDESVFEHFFNIDSNLAPRNTLLKNAITPKFGKYGSLMNIMLEANQPVLLVGEPTSGKTTLCQTLLSYDKPHVSLPASPLLASRDLRTVLSIVSCKKNCKITRLFLFVDDLHEAPCDMFGKTSAALETLRQSMSTGHILTFDTYHFNSLSTESIRYMATCCVSGLGGHHGNVMSSRLTRLFSIFVLPGLSMDVTLSIYSPRIKTWLKQIPVTHSHEDLAHCIVTATMNLYHAVCDYFQPTEQRPHFMFSHHDLQKVFSGMCLWKPKVPKVGEKEHPTVLNVARLWMHECMRTFGDRLCSEDEAQTLVSLIAKTAATHYGFVDETQQLPEDAADTLEPNGQNLEPPNLPQEPKPDLKKDHMWTEWVHLYGHMVSGLRNLQYAEETKLVYGPEISEAPSDQQHNFKCSSSYQHQHLDDILQDLCTPLNTNHNDSNLTTRFVSHRQSVSQLFHILRALLIPGGHGVLIGSERGTGRKTTVRLAAHVTGHRLVEVHLGNEHKLHEILKEAVSQTRVDGVSVIVLVHEGISQRVREEVLVAMAHRTYPGLYTDEELKDLVTRVAAGKNSRRYFGQINRNVHVFLLLPFIMTDCTDTLANDHPSGWNPHLTKALSSSCCVEVYQPWSKQSLVEVAAQSIKTSPHTRQRESSESSLSVAMAGIHQSAHRYASVLLGAQPFSPHTYMEFIAHFGFLCNHLHQQQQSQANRFAAVLSHVDAMTNTAVQRKQHLMRMQGRVAATRQREEELLKAIDFHSRQLEEASQRHVVMESKLHDLEVQIAHAQTQIGPVFLAGLKVLKCLNPSDLEEVRHYRDPPDRVVKIMDGVCLLFNRPPGWESAKQLLGQSNFFQELEFFDRYNVTNEQLQQLGQIVHSPQFESVLEVSRACESLCRWLQAVYECCSMQHRLLHKQLLEALAQEARGQLHLAKQEMKETSRCLEEMEIQLRMLRKQLEEEVMELHAAESSERNAAAAVGLMETHVRDWRAAAQEAESNHQTLLGDALILAAIISYLGPFRPAIRTELLSKWMKLCQTGGININPKDPRISLFPCHDTAPPQPPLGFPLPVCERLQLPLGRVLGRHQDALSARTVVKLLLWGWTRPWVECWPLLADSQQPLDTHCLVTGEKAELEEQTECELVVSADDPELLDKLDQAAEKGVRVLLTHMERATPSPQFLSRLVRSDGCCLTGFKQQHQPTHPDFCLFLSTHLPVQLLHSGIHASILALVRVVDLSLSQQEIQELLLTQLLQSQCETRLSRHSQLLNDKQSLQERVMVEEDALTDYIQHLNTPLLQDAAFLPRVAVCQAAVRELRAEMQTLSEELQHLQSLLDTSRPVMTLAAAFYQALQDVSRLSSSYSFSLRCFITVIQEAFRPLGTSGTAEVTNWLVAQLLVQYRPCLWKKHVPVLELLLSLALLQHHQLCSEPERAVFLRGLPHHCWARSFKNTTPPSWIPPHIHPDLLSLEEIPVFRGLIASLSTCPAQWQEYLRLPSSTVAGAVPCRSHHHLSLVQRALLWKTLVPGSLGELATAMAAFHMWLPGHTAGTPHTGNPKDLSRHLSKHEGPIVLTLDSQRQETWTSVQPLRLINRLAECAAQTKQVEVKVVSCGAPCDPEVMLSMLDAAVNDGNWLVFHNCHLLESWNDKIVARLSQLLSSVREQQRFRLWFITQEYAAGSIPAVVRARALPLVCDSPWDLKEELSSSLEQLLSAVRRRSPSLTADDMELLLRGAVFHSVLLQRQKYFHQGRVYTWSEEDLVALVDDHIFIARLCQNKAEALQYMAVSLVHGAHVHDSADLEVVDSVAKTCFSRASPLWGRGRHVLKDMTSSPGHCDLSELLQMLDEDLQAPFINDPSMLGLSEEVMAETINIKNHNLKRFLKASQTPAGAARSLHMQAATLPDYSLARNRLQALSSYLAHKNLREPQSHFLGHFFQAEWDHLVESVSSLSSQLHQTSAALLQLADMSGLERRAELLASYLWHQNASDPPGAYRLSAFTNPRGFLLAVMREAARVNRKFISDIALHFQVLSDGSYPATLPLDAVYLCGLELRGASWDTQLGALQEAVPLQPCSLDLVYVKAQVRSTGADPFPRRVSLLNGAPPPTTSQLELYHCPLYLDGGGLADDNIVTTFPLHTNIDPVLCSLRRVRLVSVL